VPEGEIGRVRLGQRAQVILDSDRQRPLEATVMRVDPEAMFTPENTYFEKDRVKQVVGVKLRITSPGGHAKPGMPADGWIFTGAETPAKAADVEAAPGAAPKGAKGAPAGAAAPGPAR
jgi:membrane fusion protein YbhG